MVDDPLDAIYGPEKPKAKSAPRKKDPLDEVWGHGPTGNIDLRTAPADDTRVTPKPKQPPKEEPGILRSAATGAAAGIPLLNKALAGFGTLMGGKYDASMADIEQQQRASKSAHPVAYKAGEVGGNLATAGAINAALPGAGLLTQGGILGGLQGLSEAKGGVGDYATKAAWDAAIGAAGGKIAGAVARPFVSFGARQAAKVIPNDVLDAIQAATGKNRRALNDLVKTVNGAGKTARDIEAETNALVPPANRGKGHEMIANAALELQQVGKRFPDVYRQTAMITDPELDATLASSPGRQLWQAAQKDAEKYGRTLATRSVTPPVPPGVSMTPEAWEAVAQKNGLSVEVPIPDPEALHFMRRAAAKDARLSDAYATIDAAVKRHVPDLEAVIRDYAKGARKFDVLAAGQDAPEYLSASTTKTPNLAIRNTEPERLAKAYPGVHGIKRSLENMTPEEQQGFRTTAQDRLSELLAAGKRPGDEQANEAWQQALFGSPENYKVFEAGARARPAQSALESVKQDIETGWIPHSVGGGKVKAAQVASRMLRGKPHLTSDTPLTAEQVLEQMLQYQRGRGMLTPLTNAAGGSVLQSVRE